MMQLEGPARAKREIVVVTHNGPIEPLIQMGGEVSVCERRAACKLGAEQFPKVGIGSELYLQHIVEKYHNLADWTIFAHERWHDHAPRLLERIKTIAEGFNFLSDNISNCDWNGRPSSEESLPLVDAWERLFPGEKKPAYLSFGPGSIFSVSKETVHKRPIEFYAKALEYHAQQPMATWVMERLWKNVFEPTLPEAGEVTRPVTDGCLREIERLYQAELKRSSDINEHLFAIRELGESCDRLTEFGVGGVVSTLALLAARPKGLCCYDLRPHPKLHKVAALAEGAGIEFQFFLEDVRKVEIEPTDLLFIDTVHRYEQLSCELRRHAANVSKYIVLHDTMTFGWKGSGGGQGLLSAVHEFLYANPEWRIESVYPHNNGLTVLKRCKAESSDCANEFREQIPRVTRMRRQQAEFSWQGLSAASGLEFPNAPSIGLVIGTFAAVPYVHLQLEARRRFYPHVPILVHDDASERSAELDELCCRYGADFERNMERQTHSQGDLTAFLGGMHWAQREGIELLVKFSRRFVPLRDWTRELQALALETQGTTYSSWEARYGFGFRTECMAISVAAWMREGVPGEIVRVLESGHCPLVEAFMHQMTRRVAERNCKAARDWTEKYGARPKDIDGYTVWPFLGFSRARKYPHLLWHDSHAPQDYAAIARQWGLRYTAADFVNPNV